MENHLKKSLEKEHSIYEDTADMNDQLIIRIRNLSHVMRFLYEGKASQKRILILLKEVKSITQRELTMRLGIQPGSASEILSKMEKAGLILRTISETDRRTMNVSLTKQGEQMALEAVSQRKERHIEMFSCLSENEKKELLSLLEKIDNDWMQRYQSVEDRPRGKRHGHGHKRHTMKMEEKIHGEVY